MLQWYFWKNKLKPNLSAVWTVKICINKRCFLMSLSYSVQILEAELRITFNMSMSPTHTAYIWFFSPVSADDFTAMTVLYFRKYPTQWTNKKRKSSVPVLQIFQTTCCWIEERMKPGRTCTNHPFPLSSFPIPGCQRRASWLIPATAPLLRRTVILHIMGIPEWFLQSCYREDAASVLRWKS